MKTILLFLLCGSCLGGELTLERVQAVSAFTNHHSLIYQFKTDITTNEPGYWQRQKDVPWLYYTNYVNGWGCMTNNYVPPFPRTTCDISHMEVYSNTYAFAVLDGDTNQIAEKHTKLGDWTSTTTTVITTSTNSLSTQEFAPVK